MLELKITAENPMEMAKTLRSFATQFEGTSPQTEMAINNAEPKKEEPKKAKAKKEEPKKEEPKKAKAKEEVKKAKAKEEVKKYTKKDVTDACQSVAQTKSLDAAKEILQKFDAVRISEVKEADYADFVGACEKAIA